MKGTLTERAPGVWRLRAYDATTGKQVSSTIRGTRRQAETALSKLVTQVDEGNAPASGSMTFGQFLTERYLPQTKRHQSPITYQQYQRRARRVMPDLGRFRLDQMRTVEVEAAVTAWSASGLGPTTCRNLLAFVRASLNYAVRLGLIPLNRALLATAPKVTRRADTMPTIEEIRRLVAESADRDPVLSAAIFLAALTGLRRGEVLGLRWSDLDRSRNALRVERAIKSLAGQPPVVGPLKTDRPRWLSIDPVTLAVLDEHRARCESWAHDAGVELGQDAYIIAWLPGGAAPGSADVLTERFRQMAKRAGVACRFHDLRHAVATTLLAEGTDLATVAARLGHSSPQVTLTVYSHALESSDRQAAGVMGALLRSTKAE